jgi:hypothetical protein
VLFLLQDKPIVVEVLRQPPVTPEVTWVEVILGAFGFAGVVMLLATTVGLLVGGLIIYRKKRDDATAPPTDPGHANLRI